MSYHGRRKMIQRSQYQGDPGLLSFLGKAAGAVVGAVVPGGKTLVSAVNMVGNALRPNPVQKMTGTSVSSPQMFASPAPSLPSLPQQGPQIGLVNINRPQMSQPYPGNQTQSGFGGQASTGAACQPGYHRNKSGYYSQRYGWVPAGSVCVKNRKRNPLNPRATSRAMSRLTSTKKAIKGISKFFGDHQRRPAAAAVASKGGCGCKGRR
jgi:hypothetical protein